MCESFACIDLRGGQGWLREMLPPYAGRSGRFIKILNDAEYDQRHLDREWSELPKIFSGHVGYNIVRFHILWGQNRREEATEVLDKVATFKPDQPVLAYRCLHQAIQQRDILAAINEAFNVSMPHDRVPIFVAVNGFKCSILFGNSGKLVAKAEAWLKQRRPLRPEAFTVLLYHMVNESQGVGIGSLLDITTSSRLPTS